jgi:phage-related protein
MTNLTTPKELLEDLELPNAIRLFDVKFNDVFYHFTDTIRPNDIFWNSNKYLPFPCAITNTGYTVDNLSETPKLVLANIGNAYSNIFASIPNLKGAEITYILTFETYINNDSVNNNNLFIEKKHYKFSRLLSKNNKQIVYELDTLLNWRNKKLPSRQILREGKLNMRFEGAGLRKQK